MNISKILTLIFICGIYRGLLAGEIPTITVDQGEGIEFGSRVTLDFDKKNDDKESKFNASRNFQISPPLKGTFEWSSPYRAVYQIEEQPIPGAIYQINWKKSKPKQVKSKPFSIEERFVLGGVGDDDVGWDHVFPEGWRLFAGSINPKRPKILLEFSHFVDVESLAQNLTLHSTNQEVYDTEISTLKNDRFSKIFLVMAAKDMPLDEEFRLEIKKEVTATGTTTKLEHSEIIVFRTESFSAFVDVKKKDGENQDGENQDGVLTLSFNFPPDFKKDPLEMISVSPPVKLKITKTRDYEDDRDKWVIEGPFDPSKTYQLGVDKDLTSIHGLPLENPGPHSIKGIQGEKFGLYFPDRKIHYRSNQGINFSYKQTSLKSSEARVTFIPDEWFSDKEPGYRVFVKTETVNFPAGYEIVNSKLEFIRKMPPEEANIKAVFLHKSRYYYLADHSFQLMENSKSPNFIRAQQAGRGKVGIVGEEIEEKEIFKFLDQMSESEQIKISSIFRDCYSHKVVRGGISYLSGRMKAVPVSKFDFPGSNGESVRSFNIPKSELKGEGAYLVEAKGESVSGKKHFNQALVFCSETVYTAKKSEKDVTKPENVIVKAFDPKTGVHLETAKIPEYVKNYYHKLSVPNQLRNRKNEDDPTALDTGEEGVETGFHSWDHHNLLSDKEELEIETLITLLTDRSMYRPNEDVYVYGVVRLRSIVSGELLPNKEPVVVSLENGDGLKVWESPEIQPSNVGAFSCQIPLLKIPPGEFLVRVLEASKRITVDHALRVPAYSVEVTTNETQPGEAPTATIRSLWRNGTPNMGAQVRWRAEWFVGGEHFGETERPLNFYTFTHYAPSPRESTVTWQGDARGLFTGGFKEERFGLFEGKGFLYSNGRLEVSAPPDQTFPKQSLPRRAQIRWTAEVIADQNGLTITENGGATAKFQASENVLGVRFTKSIEDGTGVEIKSWDAKGNETHGVPIKVKLLRVGIKTVRKGAGAITLPGGQRTSHKLVEFQNEAHVEEEILVKEVITPAHLPFTPAHSGHYIAVVEPTADRSIKVVTAECPLASAFLPGNMRHGEIVINDDLSLRCTLNEKEYRPGSTAILTISAPFRDGTAWVSVESDRVLYEKMVVIDQNVKEVEIPVDDTFFPNAFVSVYLIKPDEVAGKPLERFGICEIKVSKDSLTIKPVIDLGDKSLPGEKTDDKIAKYLPGEEIDIKIKMNVQEGEKIEVTAFAVDKNLQLLGSWTKPDLVSIFFPPRRLRVTTFRGAEHYVTEIDPLILNNKGQIIGDGAYFSMPNTLFLDNEFNPTIWRPGLFPDKNGNVRLKFAAPETNSRFELYVFAVSDKNRFGSSSKEFIVRRPVTIIPSLPKRMTETDRITVPITLINNSDESVRGTLKVNSDPIIETESFTEKQHLIPALGTIVVPVGIHAVSAGDGKIGFALQYEAGKIDTVSRDLFIYKAEVSLPFAKEGSPPTHPPVLDLLPNNGSQTLRYNILATENRSLLSMEKISSILVEKSHEFGIETRRIIALSAIERMLNHYPKESDLVNKVVIGEEIQIALQRVRDMMKKKSGLSSLDQQLYAAALKAQGKAVDLESIRLDQNLLKQPSEDIALSLFEYFGHAENEAQMKDRKDGFAPLSLELMSRDELIDLPIFLAALSVLKDDDKEDFKDSRIFKQFVNSSKEQDFKGAILLYSFLFIGGERIPIDQFVAAEKQLIAMIDRWASLDLETKCWVVQSVELQLKGRTQFKSMVPFMEIPATQSRKGGATSWLNIAKRPNPGDDQFLKQQTLSYRVEGEQVFVEKSGDLPNRSSNGVELRRKIRRFPLQRNEEIGVGQQAMIIYEIAAKHEVGPCEIHEPFPACIEWSQSEESFVRESLLESNEAPDNNSILRAESVYVAEGLTRFRFTGIPKGTSFFGVLGEVNRGGTVIWQAARFQELYNKSVSALSDTRVIECKDK